MREQIKNQKYRRGNFQVGFFMPCAVAPKLKNVKSFPAQGILF